MEAGVSNKQKTYKIIIAILIIIIISLTGYIIYEKMKKTENIDTETNNQEQNKEEEKIPNIENEKPKEEIEENDQNIENNQPQEEQLSVTDPIVLEAMSFVYRTSLEDPRYYSSGPILTPVNELTDRDLASIITSYAKDNHQEYIENYDRPSESITIENVKKIFSTLFGDQIEYRTLYCDDLRMVNVFCYNYTSGGIFNDKYMLAGGTFIATGSTTTKAIEAKKSGDYLYVIVKSMSMKKETVPDEQYFGGRIVNKHYSSYGSDQPFYSGMDLTDVQVFEQYESQIEKYQTVFLKGSDGKYHFNRSEKIVE